MIMYIGTYLLTKYLRVGIIAFLNYGIGITDIIGFNIIISYFIPYLDYLIVLHIWSFCDARLFL